MYAEFSDLRVCPLKCFILNLWTNKNSKSLPHNLTFICFQSPALICKTAFCVFLHVTKPFNSCVYGGGGVYVF